MKIKITYCDEQELEEVLRTPLLEYIKGRGRIKKSDRHEPYRHAYIVVSDGQKAPECSSGT